MTVAMHFYPELLLFLAHSSQITMHSLKCPTSQLSCLFLFQLQWLRPDSDSDVIDAKFRPELTTFVVKFREAPVVALDATFSRLWSSLFSFILVRAVLEGKLTIKIFCLSKQTDFLVEGSRTAETSAISWLFYWLFPASFWTRLWQNCVCHTCRFHCIKFLFLSLSLSLPHPPPFLFFFSLWTPHNPNQTNPTSLLPHRCCTERGWELEPQCLWPLRWRGSNATRRSLARYSSLIPHMFPVTSF